MEGALYAARVTFGAEPRDGEVCELVLKRYSALRFSPAVEAQTRQRCLHPKARQREARRQLAGEGVGTRAQRALQLQREQNGLERRALSRERRAAEERRQFEIRRQRKKQKHRDR